MSTNDPRKIVEDSPKMRSVALVSPPLMPLMQPLTPLKVSSETKFHTTPVNKISSKDIARFPAFPDDYFLERTHVRIHDATAEEVISRVSAILDHESIATVYDHKEVTIACESVDHVEFMMRFFQTDDECLIVEAQRYCGCSFSFHQLAKCVLRSAKGLPATAARPLPLPKCLPRVSEEEQQSYINEGIEIAISLMRQGSLDAQLMALESLSQMSQGSPSAAEMIFGNNEVFDFLLSFAPLSANNDYEMERSNECQMHRAAMTVIANCLESLHPNLESSKCRDALLGDSLLASLVNEISLGHEKPHEACQAIRVLQVLAQVSAETKQRIALPVGEDYRHARLGELAQQLYRTWEH